MQAYYTEEPLELLELWAEEVIPEMIESADGRSSRAALLSKKAHKKSPLFTIHL